MTSTSEDIHRAIYRKKRQLLDSNHTSDESYNEILKDAYSILMDGNKRRGYDYELQQRYKFTKSIKTDKPKLQKEAIEPIYENTDVKYSINETTTSEAIKPNTSNTKIQKNKVYLVILTVIVLSIISYNFMYKRAKLAALKHIPQDGIIKLIVKFDSVAEVENNHVGNSWSYNFKVNNINLSEGKEVVINTSLKNDLAISVLATENDSIPDSGSKSNHISINNLDLSRENNYSLDVIVRENRGRYSGNTAIQKFNFTIKRDVNFGEVINAIFN